MHLCDIPSLKICNGAVSGSLFSVTLHSILGPVLHSGKNLCFWGWRWGDKSHHSNYSLYHQHLLKVFYVQSPELLHIHKSFLYSIFTTTQGGKYIFTIAMRKLGLKRSTNLLKFIKPASGRAKIQTQLHLMQCSFS